MIYYSKRGEEEINLLYLSKTQMRSCWRERCWEWHTTTVLLERGEKLPIAWAHSRTTDRHRNFFWFRTIDRRTKVPFCCCCYCWLLLLSRTFPSIEQIRTTSTSKFRFGIRTYTPQFWYGPSRPNFSDGSTLYIAANWEPKSINPGKILHCLNKVPRNEKNESHVDFRMFSLATGSRWS